MPLSAIADRPGLLVVPILLPLLAAAEGAWRMRKGMGYDWKAWWTSLGDAFGRILINRTIGGGVVGLLLIGVARFRVADIAMDRWWHWMLLFVGQEFCYYWMHRADHRVRWFWLNHAVHHSPEQYALSSAYRLGWTGKITSAAVFFAPLVWLGFPAPLVLATLALNLSYQFWLHTELIGKLPRPIECVFNTPAHHRVHHASNPEYLDCNYGGRADRVRSHLRHLARGKARRADPLRTDRAVAQLQPGEDRLPCLVRDVPRPAPGARLAQALVGGVRPAELPAQPSPDTKPSCGHSQYFALTGSGFHTMLWPSVPAARKPTDQKGSRSNAGTAPQR